MNGGRTVSQLVQEGWRFYRAPKHSGDSCEHLRGVERHLAEMVKVLSQLFEDGPVALRGPEEAWPLIEQWLRMAAGLHFVDLDLHEFDHSFMCGEAMDYEEAAGWVASLYATEYTRLLYTWNATELFVKHLALPPVKEAPGWINAATLVLKKYWEQSAALPDHYAGVLRHLKDHVKADPALGKRKRLVGALEETSWRGQSGLLLAASHQLRHVPAHGNLQIPEPDRWGEDMKEREASPAALHVPRLGVRGLLFGLQMVLVAILPEDLRLGDDFRGEWFVRDGDRNWIEATHPLVKDVLMHVQLEPEGS